MGTKQHLHCEVSPGQFSSEYAISGDTYDGKGFSMFVPKELIIHDKIAWIQVEEINRDGDRVLV